MQRCLHYGERDESEILVFLRTKRIVLEMIVRCRESVSERSRKDEFPTVLTVLIYTENC